MKLLRTCLFLALAVLVIGVFPAAAQNTHITVTAQPGDVVQEPIVPPANPYPSEVIQTPHGPVPVYRVTVIGRTIHSINYRYRRGDTNVAFAGTPLLPGADGRAVVRSNQGFTKVDAHFHHLPPASVLGPLYMTYVLWAITPNGRAANIGELVPNGDNSTDVHVTTDLQAFGLMVTAEPYFSVTLPSDMVVMENRITDTTQGIIEQVDAKYELLKRGSYTYNIPASQLTPIPVRGDLLQVAEAQNAERIARWFGADRDAADTFNKAATLMAQALGYGTRDRKSAAMMARQATQEFEDARLIAVNRQEEARQAAARAAQAEAQERTRDLAQEEARLRAQAEERRRLETERAAEAEAARRQAEAAQQQALTAQQQAQAEAERARQEAARAQQESAQAREQLRDQLSQIMQTRETARGLIMTMSDVLFDTGKSTLKPGAREKLAKVAGIMIAHPDLKLEIEGFTDSTGSVEFNQVLSEKRAGSVRDFLLVQGVRLENVTARGFGQDMPVASNATATGRQLNRRVEIVVSGAGIGQPAEPGIVSHR